MTAGDGRGGLGPRLPRDVRKGQLGMVRTFSAGSDRLSYEVHGSGPRVLVWLHGLFWTLNSTEAWPPNWRPAATA